MEISIYTLLNRLELSSSIQMEFKHIICSVYDLVDSLVKKGVDWATLLIAWSDVFLLSLFLFGDHMLGIKLL